MPKRVLVIGEYGTLNGGENSFLAVAPALIKLGWEFHAAVPVDSPFANALRALGIGIDNLEMQDLGGQRKTQLEIRAEITNIIGFVEPDLIHCNSLSTSRICGPIANQLDVPSLGYLRDILKLSKKAIADINELDRIIAVSNATRDWHIKQGIASKKTWVVYNGVDTDLFSSRDDCDQTKTTCPVRSELGISVEAPVLLFVGQIGIRKGVDTLVDAFLSAAESIPDAHLMIAGQRHSQKQEAIEYEQRLKNRTESSIHKQKIHWLGVRSDVPMLMRASTVLVHPARQEPLGRVLLEAAASGLPVITTRVGGSPEILRGPEFKELLIEPNDSIELSARIVDLIRDGQRLETLNWELRKIATRRFTIDRCARELDTHYCQLLAR